MGFRNAIAAGTKLVRDALESPNFIAGLQGWTIRKDGSSEFSDSVIRGTITSGDLAGSHIVIDPNASVAFNNGVLQAVIEMFPDDPNMMMQGMLGNVTFDAGQASAQMATVLHSPIGTEGFGLVLASEADDLSIANYAALGVVILSGEAMTFIPILTLEGYGANSESFLVYSTDSPGQNVKTFGVPGANSWTAPPGVTSVRVEAWGGGGRGSNAVNGGGAGGGGEFAAEATLAVTPGTVYTANVGAGSTSLANGVDSTFAGDAVTVTAHGGKTSTTGTGGNGGSGSTNGSHHSGGRGGDASAAKGGGGGGGAGGTTHAGGIGENGHATGGGGNPGAGGATGGGAGGIGGGLNTTAGAAGVAPGGGGGGAGGGTSPGPGNGANGQIRLTYTPSGSTPLVASIANATTIDKFGNTFQKGAARYDSAGDGTVLSGAKLADTASRTASAAVSTVITNLWTIPANDMVAGCSYRLTAWGDGNQGTTQQALTMAPQLNGAGVTLSQHGVFTAAQVAVSAGLRWRVTIDLICVSTGVAGTVLSTMGGTLIVAVAGATSFGIGASPTAPVVVDTTAPITLSLTATWGAATGVPRLICRGSLFERLGP